MGSGSSFSIRFGSKFCHVFRLVTRLEALPFIWPGTAAPIPTISSQEMPDSATRPFTPSIMASVILPASSSLNGSACWKQMRPFKSVMQMTRAFWGKLQTDAVSPAGYNIDQNPLAARGALVCGDFSQLLYKSFRNQRGNVHGYRCGRDLGLFCDIGSGNGRVPVNTLQYPAPVEAFFFFPLYMAAATSFFHRYNFTRACGKQVSNKL